LLQMLGLPGLAEQRSEKPFGFGHKCGHNQAAFL
jgi:hypothetical protein